MIDSWGGHRDDRDAGGTRGQRVAEPQPARAADRDGPRPAGDAREGLQRAVGPGPPARTRTHGGRAGRLRPGGAGRHLLRTPGAAPLPQGHGGPRPGRGPADRGPIRRRPRAAVDDGQDRPRAAQAGLVAARVRRAEGADLRGPARQAARGAAAGLAGGGGAVRGQGLAPVGRGHLRRRLAGPGAVLQAGAEGRGQGSCDREDAVGPAGPLLASGSVESFVDELPKAELHLHLVGSASVPTVLELARRHPAGNGIPRTEPELRAFFEFRDFPHFAEVYGAVSALVREPADVAALVTGAARDLAGQNVRYAELTVTPYTFTSFGMPARELTWALDIAAGVAGREHGVRIGYIFDIASELGADAARATLD